MNHNISDISLSKKQSLQIQGIAILFMLIHHLYWDESTVSHFVCNEDIVIGTAWFCRICVGLFAFVSGYGIYHAIKNDPISVAYNKLIRKVGTLFSKLWLVLILFKGFDFLILDKEYNFIELLRNMLAINTSYNGSWWYVRQYFFMLMVIPLFHQALRRQMKLLERLIYLVTFSVIVLLLYYLQAFEPKYLLVFLSGYFFARFHAFHYLYTKSNLVNIIVSIVMLIVSIVFRVLTTKTVESINFEFIIVPIFVYGIIGIIWYIKPLQFVLEWCGKHSTYIWLSHIFLFDYIENLLHYRITNVFLYATITITICFVVGLMVEYLGKGLLICWNKRIPHSVTMLVLLFVAIMLHLSVQYSSFSLQFSQDEVEAEYSYVFYEKKQADSTNINELIDHYNTHMKRRISFNRDFLPGKTGVLCYMEKRDYDVEDVEIKWFDISIHQYDIDEVESYICDTINVNKCYVEDNKLKIISSGENSIVWYSEKLAETYLDTIKRFTNIVRIIEIALFIVAVSFGCIELFHKRIKKL